MPTCPRSVVRLIAVLGWVSYAVTPFPLFGQGSQTVSDTTFPYVLSDPDTVFTLPKTLDEVSGLAAMDDLFVAAVQDEIGSVFLINIQSGLVSRSIRFAGRGDYEGIERVRERLYVLESNGDLFELSANYDEWPERTKARRIRTRLSSRYDAEGLAYNPVTDQLLIACKEYPGKGFGNQRAVYAFDVQTETLSEKPAYLFSIDTIDGIIDGGSIKYRDFSPSALAVHPVSGHLFLISSREQFVLDIDSTGTVLSGERLANRSFPQPEGISFLPDGRMVIASEAGSRRATVSVYSPLFNNN